MGTHFNDGFGASVEQDFEQLEADWRALLYKHANQLLQWEKSFIEDVVQEGRITLWKTWAELPADDPHRAHKALAHAKLRMKEVAYRSGSRQTGNESETKVYEPKKKVSVEHEGETVEEWFGGVDALDGVEIAYHRGEILQAVDALTEKQRKYVYARFWYGIDMPAGSRSEVIKELKDQNPFLRRDVLWTGNKTTRGAKDRLREALAHLSVV